MDEGHRTSERKLNIFQGLCEILKVYRGIVQLVERWSPKPNVEGSSPSTPAIQKTCGNHESFLYVMMRRIERNILELIYILVTKWTKYICMIYLSQMK